MRIKRGFSLLIFMGKSLGGAVKDCERRVVLWNFFEKIRNKEKNFNEEEKTNARRARNFLRKMAEDLVESSYSRRKLVECSLPGRIYSAFGGDAKSPVREEMLEYASEIRGMQKRIGLILKSPEKFYNSEEYGIFLEDCINLCYGCI